MDLFTLDRALTPAERNHLSGKTAGGHRRPQAKGYAAEPGAGPTGEPLCCDHVVPVSRGGQTCECNLAAACGPCNSSKRDRTPEEWGGPWR